ncbi:MAG TPA: SRPBCC family protein [Streptosporangiaceae bacterium]|nr:SRPBCC family protein [Streptosporangiaceae bacterium]
MPASAFVDSYHIQYAHPNTAGKHVHTNVQTVEDFGRHARMVSPRKTIDRWLEEDPGDRDLGPYVTEGHYLLPNSTLLRQPDDHFELLTFRPHPADPGHCRMEMRLLVPPLEASEMTPERYERVWEKNWAILLAVLHSEDFPLLRSSQDGLASADAGGMLLGRNEVVNQILLDAYLAAIQSRAVRPCPVRYRGGRAGYGGRPAPARGAVRRGWRRGAGRAAGARRDRPRARPRCLAGSALETHMNRCLRGAAAVAGIGSARPRPW